MSNRRTIDMIDVKYRKVHEVYEPLPRLVKRDLQFHQSRQKLNIEMKDLSKHGTQLRKEDWFHVFLRFSTGYSLGFMICIWTATILMYAGMYMLVDYSYYGTNCGLVSPESKTRTMGYGAYFAFSLETTTTVGYGLPGSTNAFFESCPMVQVVIYFQMVWSMLYNAFLFAFFFARLAKTESRGSQVIFSDTAVMTRHSGSDKFVGDKGPWRFCIRVADVDAAHPVVEAHVRMYAKVGTQLIEMRIVAPNDELGANLFLSWPLTVKHEIDVHSPLRPPVGDDPFRLSNAGLNLRNADSIVGSNTEYSCPICGESYGDMTRLRKHFTYAQIQERQDEYPIEGTHQAYDLEKFFQPLKEPAAKELLDWFPDEIIVMVEGIDSLASGTFQAIQSYTAQNLSWGGGFEDCVFFRTDGTTVDLNKFHNVIIQNPNDIVDIGLLDENDRLKPCSIRRGRSNPEAVFDEEVGGILLAANGKSSVAETQDITCEIEDDILKKA
mmetsp:Transcript_25834/g.38997  ORF Transcript_25834/g.38997 Transcript_25834/m.38997 type:complete len:494 (-) Transcript_25834:73-1554(-)